MVLGATITNMLPKMYQKKTRIGRPTKNRLHIFFDERAKAFSRWDEIQEPLDFPGCEEFIN
jgi:hypothetical protein